MSVQAFIARVSGKLQEIIATTSSLGASSAGQIPALDVNGKLDQTMMPAGIGPALTVAPASEALVAGAYVNFWTNAGVLNVRNADTTAASAGGKQADGFVVAACASGANASVYPLNDQNNQLSGLTPGAPYYAGAAGAVVTPAPTGANVLLQYLGKAINATTIQGNPEDPVLLAQ